MCHPSVLEFGEFFLTPSAVAERDVLEVGALNVNGSLREHVLSLNPTRYVGVDIVYGPGVDQICDAAFLANTFGEESFDLVISTEMLEHCEPWRLAISNMKRVLRPGGTLLLTTRSEGFALHHEHPGDFWRFGVGDMRVIFSDMELIHLETDPGGSGGGPGVFVVVLKPPLFVENDLRDFHVYSMQLGRRGDEEGG